MMYQVLYFSKGGNTRNLADAIAGELGVTAEDVGSSSMDRNARVILLGSGVYKGKPGRDLIEFIETHDFRGRRVRIFSTSWLTGENAFAGVADALKKKGAIVQQGYHCKGKFGIFNRGHPDREDLDGARKFARELVPGG
jgi:flavodoxin